MRVCVYMESTNNLLVIISTVLLVDRLSHQKEPHPDLIEKTVFLPERLDIELYAVNGWNFGQRRQEAKGNSMAKRTPCYRACYYFTKNLLVASFAIRWGPGHRF